jgi:chromosome segregation and condensation protein ScpB
MSQGSGILSQRFHRQVRTQVGRSALEIPAVIAYEQPSAARALMSCARSTAVLKACCRRLMAVAGAQTRRGDLSYTRQRTTP